LYIIQRLTLHRVSTALQKKLGSKRILENIEKSFYDRVSAEDQPEAIGDLLWDIATHHNDQETLKMYTEIENAVNNAISLPQNAKRLKMEFERASDQLNIPPQNLEEDKTGNMHRYATPSPISHTDFDQEFPPVDKRKDFYNSTDTITVGPIQVRLFYHEREGISFVHWVKRNGSLSTDIRDTHMRCALYDLESIIPRMRQIIREIGETPRNRIIPFLEGDTLSIEMRNDKSFWSPMYTIVTPSENLMIRPIRADDGVYKFILMNPKFSRTLQMQQSNWIGSLHTLFVGELIKFIDSIDHFLKLDEDTTDTL